jgi:acetylornithine deacetylase/succinyl-diaminopimelate desuccinylase-like protein
MKDELCGTVKFAFQPAEEIGKGAASMIEQGAMDDVDGAFGIHIWSDVESGKVACSAGPRMGAANMFTVDIQGRGGHGSSPHQCVDAAGNAHDIIDNRRGIIHDLRHDVFPCDDQLFAFDAQKIDFQQKLIDSVRIHGNEVGNVDNNRFYGIHQLRHHDTEKSGQQGKQYNKGNDRRKRSVQSGKFFNPENGLI